jgi:hypothetical protein
VIKLRRFRWARYVARIGKVKNSYTPSVGKLKRKRPLRRFSCGWENNIKMYLKGTGYDVVGWFQVAEDTNQSRTLENRVT